MIRRMVGATVLMGALAFASQAHAGSIYLSGHDILLHSGQNSYDNVILDYLRGEGTSSEIAAASYDIVLIRSFARGGLGTIGVNTLEGFGTITQVDIATLSGAGGAAAFAAAVAGADVVVIPDHLSCGGCNLSTAEADILDERSADIAAFFNAGGDLFVGSGASDPGFYSFLPPSAVATGTPIGGSFGFVATPDGVAIGILPDMINGFPTHNRFSSFDPDFTVFEVRPQTSGVNEIISIGLREGRIVDDIIVVEDTDGDGDGTVPEPGTLALLGLGLAGAAAARRRRAS
jgi:hypothetical protein